MPLLVLFLRGCRLCAVPRLVAWCCAGLVEFCRAASPARAGCVAAETITGKAARTNTTKLRFTMFLSTE